VSEDPDRHRDDQGLSESSSKSVAERTVELLVYAPAGLVVSVLDDLPTFVARGRSSVELQVRNARLLGEFAVGKARRDVARRLHRLTPSTKPSPTAAEEPAPTSPPASPTDDPRALGAERGSADPVACPAEPGDERPAPKEEGLGSHPSAPPPTPAPTPARTSRAPESPEHLAIVDYDALSASQVVRRLDGLGAGELEAVYRHESATRRRRTILHRAQQLLEADRGDHSTGSV
jgi:hypothetical protein